MWSLSIMLNLMNSMKKKIITGINKLLVCAKSCATKTKSASFNVFEMPRASTALTLSCINYAQQLQDK